jgi:phosphoglycerate kinase
MKVTTEDMLRWCRVLLGDEKDAPKLTLEQYLAVIPRLESLSNVPSGTVVLVRGDLDAKPGEKIGQGDERLRSMVDTLKFGIQKGWKQVVFGHIGRKPEGSLKAVAARLGELLGRDVPLVGDWLDESGPTITNPALSVIQAAAPGSVIVLENTRKYKIERVLWDATPDNLPKLAPSLATLANQFAERIGTVYVNEALSAGSLDSSTTIVPGAMDRVALGKYVAGEFDGPMRRCLLVQLVVFSGLKTDKLDDLQAMIDRGEHFCMGVQEDPAKSKEAFYISPQRVEQAKRMIALGRQKGIEFVLPVDFVLQDGRVAETLQPTDQQFDVGPKSSEHFAEKVGEFIEWCKKLPADQPRVAFYNGVFGMFEDPRFENGTRRFIEQLRRMKESGIEVYVGGGEGGAALVKYGKPDWVTHCFTAGGTVLNALGSNPVPYLQALAMAATRK